MTERGRPDDGREVELVPEDDRIIGVALRWSVTVLVVLALMVAAGIYIARPRPEVVETIERGPIVPPAPLVFDAPARPSVQFTEITTDAGIGFVHENGAVGEKLLPETMGGGCAFLDYDGDDDQDIIFINSGRWSDLRARRNAPVAVLYRNDGSGRFTDASSAIALDAAMYGMGVAVADYDNDGDADLYITALGGNRLLRNDSGRFVDVTDRAGVAGGDDDWSTSAGFFDYDLDGDLDLFVCNYVKWSRELDLELNFTLNGTDRAYGPPKLYRGTFSRLYRNEGDGRFNDVSEPAGIHVTNPATGEPMGKALAVTFVDVDRDGHLDILVANDTVQNFLFRNIGGERFEEVGAMSGVAFDGMGAATGAMGMDVADYADRGALAVGIGNFANETTSFYVQQADPWVFADMSSSEGIGSPSRLKLTFGLFFFDYDLDGRLDLLQANGHLEDEINLVQPSQRYRQPAQLFWNCGPEARSCYALVPEDEAGDLSRPIVGRGAAYADVDGDGDEDVLLTQINGPPLLLRNDQSLGHNWLRVHLVGTNGNRDAIGAWVEITAGGVTRRRQIMPTRSYLSQVALPTTIGLGDADRIDSLKIRWPDGSDQTVAVGGVNRAIRIIQEPSR